MKKFLSIFLVIFALFLFLPAGSLAADPSYFVLGDSTASGTISPNVGSKPTTVNLDGRMPLNREMYLQKKAEYQQKLTTLRDARKKQIVENLTNKLSEVNKRRTSHWQEVLARLNNVLSKIKAKSDYLKSQGKNTADLDSSITAAQAKIDAAKAAVDAQANKDYLVNVTSETALRINVNSTVMGEKSDLMAVNNTVKEAYQAVSNAIQILRKLVGQNPTQPASPSGIPIKPTLTP